ncbi:ComF family protein [Gracilimonas sp. Q87]|uniref:ComF family protein n=1 Tax=Gracilimonas sp. Q87 TaxID=3384766 RepID=UPI003983DC02
MNIIRFKEGLMEVLFPKVCVVCGHSLSTNENVICVECLHSKFEETVPNGSATSQGVLLPEGINLQHALWTFDKGGYLQDLLHQLKYHRITGVGEDIGRQLGKSMEANPLLEEFIHKERYLLPVPLHSKKRRIRGYNQAYYIAKGISHVIGGNIIPKKAVLRIKNTKTQTGFSLIKRRNNIENAFKVITQNMVKGKNIIIVDDVFTTGSTTFELASVLKASGCEKIAIVTIAQA